MTLQEMHEWVFDELGFCGCGDPEGALEFLTTVLSAIRKRSNESREIEESDQASSERWGRNSDAIRDLIGMSGDVPLGTRNHREAMAWSYLYHLSHLDLLEHGGNCSGSWLTEKGEQILDDLLKYSSESIIECDDQAETTLEAQFIDA